MSVVTVQTAAPAVQAAPRGARWASSAFITVTRAVLRGVEAITSLTAAAADRRARREMLVLARQYEALQPGVAAELRAAAQRN